MKWLINLFVLSCKQVRRNRIKSSLTILGTAAGMFLFLTVSSMQMSLKKTTEVQAGDDTLVVYRDKRFCPFTSRLPIDYRRKISALAGVKSVTPVKVIVSNCGTSLDTVCFRGIPKESVRSFLAEVKLLQGSFGNWEHSSDGAFLGESLAKRRGLKLGDKFDAAGITVRVAGIVSSTNEQQKNVAYVHLDFLQQASGHGLGVVTQFNVKVNDYRNLEKVAKEIDLLFARDREPTHTRPEKAFVAQIAKNMVELVGFTHILGVGAVFAVLTLITNTIILAVRSRMKDIAVLRAIGYRGEHLLWITLGEGLIYGFCGGLIGIVLAYTMIYYGHFSISNEGVSLVISANKSLLVQAITLALSLGFIAGLYPAILANRGSVADSLRRV